MLLNRLAPISLFLLVSGLSASAFAQFEAPSKAELEMTSDPKAPGAAAVYLDRVEATDDPHNFVTVYARMKVFTEGGKEAATVNIPDPASFVFHAVGDNSSRMGGGANHWDAPDMNHAGEDRPNELDNFKVKKEVSALQARSIHPDGTIVPLTGSTLANLHVVHKPGGHDETSFTIPGVEVGSVLEYRYQLRYDRFEGAPDWQIQKKYFIHHAHFAFTPDERFSASRTRGGAAGLSDASLIDSHGEAMTDIRSGVILPPGTTVRAEALGGYSLDMSDVPAFPSEAYSTPAEGQAYRVSFYYLPTPDEKEFWQRQMSFWMKGLDKYIAPTPPLESLVKELMSGAATPLDKAKKLYAFTARIKNTDFTADGEPGSGSDSIPAGRADKLLIDKKGTSNEIAYFYLAMAKIAGLDARPERIASRSRRMFSPQFRTTAQLDTVLISLNIDGKEIATDPGSPMAPFGTLHWAHAAAGGIVLTGGKVETFVTPMQKGTDNTTYRIGDLKVTPQGIVSGTVKLAFVGQEALRLRQIGVLSGANAVVADLNKTLAGQVSSGMTAKVDHVAYLTEPGKQLLAVVNISGPLPHQQSSGSSLPRNLFGVGANNPFPEEQERKLTIDVRYPEVDEEKITYILPSGFALTTKPENEALNWDSVGYKSSVVMDKNNVTVSRVFARGFTLLQADKYGSLRDFYQKVIAADQHQLVFNAGTQASNVQ